MPAKVSPQQQPSCYSLPRYHLHNILKSLATPPGLEPGTFSLEGYQFPNIFNAQLDISSDHAPLNPLHSSTLSKCRVQVIRRSMTVEATLTPALDPLPRELSKSSQKAEAGISPKGAPTSPRPAYGVGHRIRDGSNASSRRHEKHAGAWAYAAATAHLTHAFGGGITFREM